MLNRVLPEQVSAAWDYYKECIGAALPPYVELNQQAMTNILTAILLGKAVVWVYTIGREVHATILTYVREHDLTRQKQLEIYAVYATEVVTPEKFKDALRVLQAYARSKGCQVIIGYSAEEEWVRYLSMMGANVNFRLIEFNVEE